MTRIRFEPSGREVEVVGPEALIDVIDELPGTQVRLACRAAHCAACRVRVEGGVTGLEPAEPMERQTLMQLLLPADHRLACQLRLRPQSHEPIVLRVVEQADALTQGRP